MKKLFLKMSVLLLASFMIFTSCKHDVKDKEGGENPKDVPKLVLETLTIHKKPVEKKKVTLSQDQIVAGDIEAHFSYGSVSDEKIDVVVKDSPFVLDKTKPKTLHISVPAKKDTYKEWEGSVEVSWEKEEELSTDLITAASLSGSYENGTQFFATKEQMNLFMKNQGLILEMKGPQAIILFGSNKVTWTKCLVNEKELPFQPYPALGFKSVVMVALDLPQVGQTNEYKVLVEAGDKKQKTSFKIKRLEGTVDIPYLKLIVVASDVITDKNLPQLFDGSRPKFRGTDPCHIEVQCANDAVASCVIDGSSPISMQTKTVNKKEIWYAEHSVTGIDPHNGKDVDVLIKPKNTHDYHETVWKFHLTYQAKTPMNVIYTFNNKARRELGTEFVNDLEAGKKPTLTVANASFLNMKLYAVAKLSEVNVNGTSFTGSALQSKGIGTIFYHSLPITTTEQDVRIVLVPKDTGKYATKVFEFKVKGDGNKEKLDPSLSINETFNFSDEFITGLTNGSKPLHKVFKSPANIEVSVDEYTYTFLTSSIKINEENIQIIEEKKGYKTYYLAKKAIDVTELEAKDVKIEFVPKTENMILPLIWEFKVQGGAEKPVFPKDKISLFTINGVGGYGDPLPKELIDNLTTSNPYTYIIDANQAVIEVGWYKEVNEMLKYAIFEVDGNATTVNSVKRSNAYICSHTISLPDQAEHTVNIKMIPNEDANYKELVYSFKIKNSGLLPKMPLKYGFEDFPILDGDEKEIETDMPIIAVTSVEDNDEKIMEEVTINGEKVEIEKKKATNGDGFIFEAIKAVDISHTNYTDITISVTPKDATKYRVTTCAFKLKAKNAMPKDNGEFDFDASGTQRVLYDVEWVDSQERDASNDHGAKTAIITFFTKSPHAKVKYKKVFIGEDKDNEIVFEKDLSSFEDAKHIGNKHISKKIELDQDKPITIKAEVVPDEGSTDPKKGVYYFMFNPVVLLWDYAEGATHASYTNSVNDLQEAQGVKTPIIKVDRTKIQGGKIYLALSAWLEDYGCTVADNVNFSLLDVEKSIQWYKATIDVSSLNSQIDEKEVSFPLLFNGKPSFTYKFKIKLQ